METTNQKEPEMSIKEPNVTRNVNLLITRNQERAATGQDEQEETRMEIIDHTLYFKNIKIYLYNSSMNQSENLRIHII